MSSYNEHARAWPRLNKLICPEGDISLVIMKAASLIVGLVLVSVFALSMAPGASAATATVSPGTPFSKTVHADMLDRIDFSWSISPSTASVDFIVLQPGGTEYMSYTGSDYSFFVIAGLSGDYTFRWTNTGSTAVTLTYDLSGGGGVGGALDFALMLFIIGAIVVVIIVVVIIVVLVRGGKKQVAPPPAYGPPQQFAPPGETPAPYMANVCPKCGGPIDSQQVFCPKCGFRVR
jgi:hypothetical protein